MKSRHTVFRIPALAALVAPFLSVPSAYALPSFARQTEQKCTACHVGGNWPQLTPWGRFFKLSGYTAGASLMHREGAGHVPLGVFGQAGLTWAAQPNNTQGQSVITHNGDPEVYQFTAEVATKLTNFLGSRCLLRIPGCQPVPGLEGRFRRGGRSGCPFLSLGRQRGLNRSR